MTPEQTFAELLGRIGASSGETVLVSEEELAGWPDSAVQAFKVGGLLTSASPASSVVCPGCEEQCIMPLHTQASGSARVAFFVVCDKRDDISRVPVSVGRLRQWGTSFLGLAGLIARLLDLPEPVSGNGARCELGVLRGRKHSSQVALISDGDLKLHVAGHFVGVSTVLTLKTGAMVVDRLTLVRFADKPLTGGGDVEGAAMRRKRLTAGVKAEKSKGTKAFLKTVAGRENISVQRLKQILKTKPDSAKKPQKISARWTS